LNITEKTVAELCAGLAGKQFSSREITEAFLARIEAVDGVLNAYITVTGELALAQADEADARRTHGEARSALDGIPLALKDNYCTRDVRTTCASKMLDNFVPSYSATCWDKLQQAGAVLLGKTNMDEFAVGNTSETSAYGASRNPFAIGHVAGDGAAAAVAADLAAFAVSSGTGGDTRQPAPFCGVGGLKPSYGRVSRAALISNASSMDQAGLLAKTVRDAATVLEVIAGPDAADSTTMLAEAGAFCAACDKSVQGLKVGLPVEYLSGGLDAQTQKAVYQATDRLRELGTKVEEVSLPHSKYALPVYHVLASAEASANLARYDGVQYGLRVERDNVYDMYTATRSAGFGDEAKRRIILGTYVLSAEHIEDYYMRALKVRTLVKGDYDALFAVGYDCLLTPVSAGLSPQLAERLHDVMANYTADRYTAAVNLAGLPALSLPFALQGSLPLGIQLIGRPFGEEALLAAAAALEQPRFVAADIVAQEKGVACHD